MSEIEPPEPEPEPEPESSLFCVLLAHHHTFCQALLRKRAKHIQVSIYLVGNKVWTRIYWMLLYCVKTIYPTKKRYLFERRRSLPAGLFSRWMFFTEHANRRIVHEFWTFSLSSSYMYMCICRTVKGVTENWWELKWIKRVMCSGLPKIPTVTQGSLMVMILGD